MALLLDKKKAAEALGLSVVSVDRLRKAGKLPYRQIGGLVKFCQDDIDRYVESAGVNVRAETEAAK
jgi:excisionase family DNA binding protein